MVQAPNIRAYVCVVACCCMYLLRVFACCLRVVCVFLPVFVSVVASLCVCVCVSVFELPLCVSVFELLFPPFGGTECGKKREREREKNKQKKHRAPPGGSKFSESEAWSWGAALAPESQTERGWRWLNFGEIPLGESKVGCFKKKRLLKLIEKGLTFCFFLQRLGHWPSPG